MTYVHPRWSTYIWPVYLLGGLAIGLAVPALKNVAAAQFGRSGLAVAFVINLAMPAATSPSGTWRPGDCDSSRPAHERPTVTG